MDNSRKDTIQAAPNWPITILSAVLGGGAIWYSWLIYNHILHQSGFLWHDWTRLAFMMLMGVLCLAATVLFIARKSSGRIVLKCGLSMIILVFFTNLVILVIRALQNIGQGDVQPFLAQFFTQPRNIIIPIIVIALVLLGHIEETVKRQR